MPSVFLRSMLLSLFLGNILAPTFFSEAYMSNVLLKETGNSTQFQNHQRTLQNLEPVFQKGMSYATYANMTPDVYASVNSDESLVRMRQVNVEWVAINVVWFQQNASSTRIYPHLNKSPSNNSIIHAIAKAHSLNMSVMLKPMIDLEDGRWRGCIEPSTVWFQNYANFLNFFAELAEQNNVEMFCIGTELNRTVSWEPEWRNIVSGVRQRYSGQLTYAATWYKEYDKLIQWWDALDYVGINAYFPLSNKSDPSINEMKNTWENVANYLDEFYSKVERPIIFTEIGYLSTDGTNKNASNYRLQTESGRLIDLQEQADCYEAAFQALWNKSWFFGMYWWYWQTNPDAGGSNNSDYTPQNKPAQGVLTHWYSQSRRLNTQITLDPNNVNITIDNSLTWKAKLVDENNYSMPNEIIEFYLYINNSEEYIGSAKTDSNGIATITYTPDKTGVFKIRAKFLGSQNHESSVSEHATLTVKSVESRDYLIFIIGGVFVLVLIEAMAIIFLWRKVRLFRKPNI